MYRLDRYLGTVTLAVIFLSFLLAILGFKNIFITIGINLAILSIVFNLAALLYGIATRHRVNYPE